MSSNVKKTLSNLKVFSDNEVVYICSDPSTAHKVEVHFISKTIYVYANLKDLEKENTFFFRCHKSFIVNTKHILSYSNNEYLLLMRNNDFVPVSRRKAKYLSLHLP